MIPGSPSTRCSSPGRTTSCRRRCRPGTRWSRPRSAAPPRWATAVEPAGLNSWHDAATFTRAGTPTFSFGPDGIDTAHAANERVSVGGLVDFSAAVALTLLRWCGAA